MSRGHGINWDDPQFTTSYAVKAPWYDEKSGIIL